ncbi:MAG: zinc ribbon domain-containing protein [Calditrichaeota bacterium]|nr:MAG: zinc ribbon domain-containing protein [Calditrichota bacterium]
MPIYEYRCSNCGAKFELLRRSSDSDEEIRCEHCGQQRVERLFSAFATSGGGEASFASSSSACDTSSGFS